MSKKICARKQSGEAFAFESVGDGGRKREREKEREEHVFGTKRKKKILSGEMMQSMAIHQKVWK